jgi:PhzF family phenazine biosynthesis protein
MDITIKQVDAFTDSPLQGNPAAVVLHGEGLTDAMMQSIAQEMALSETAFLLPPTANGADLRLRWFTPGAEVPLCGHATVATFHAVAEERLHGTAEQARRAFRVETRSGILPVTVVQSAQGPPGAQSGPGATVHFGLPVPHFQPAFQHRENILLALNLNARELDPSLPIVVDRYVYVPVLDRRTLFALKPDFSAIDAFQRRNNVGGICVFTTDVVDPGSAVHSRFFCPADGINEDPVTGSANGPLGVYLFEQGVVAAKGESLSMIGEQGDAIGRRGRVTISLRLAAGKVSAVEISGRAVTVFTTKMRLR